MMREKVKQLKHNYTLRCLYSFVMVILSAMLQAYVIQVFITSSGLLSSGFTGLAILINRITGLFGFELDVSMLIILLNVPVALMCCRSISVKFTVFSSIQFISASIFLKLFQFPPLFEDILLNCIIGGVLYGFSILIALVGNASTGGTDFVALYVSNKINKSIWSRVFAFNCIMLIIFGAMFSWEMAAYSIVFQYISTKTIDSFHHRYDRVTLQITTEKAEEVVDAYVENYRHGITVTPSYGGFSRKKYYLLHTVVSSYEVRDIIQLLREADPQVIVNMTKTENFVGGFYSKKIE